MERHHFAGYHRPHIFASVCKTCHEWADKKHKDTWKGDRRIKLSDFVEFAYKLNRYNEFFDEHGKLKDKSILKTLKLTKYSSLHLNEMHLLWIAY